MNFLIDIIPAKARRYVYGALSLLALVYGVWEAAGGDWKAFVTALIAMAGTALAHANTTPERPDDGG